MPKRARVPGMRVRSDPRPLCSVDPKHTVQRNLGGGWICQDCYRDFAKEHLQAIQDNIGSTEGGVALPVGVKDERREAIEVPDNPLPNRATRRRLRG